MLKGIFNNDHHAFELHGGNALLRKICEFSCELCVEDLQELARVRIRMGVPVKPNARRIWFSRKRW
jgi:hypothetical protein